MDLKIIRGYLDTLDKALMYILMQRVSIIPLVAESKIKQGLPFYQPKREEQMYEFMKSFAESNGLNAELLVEVFKDIIKESLRIEHQFEEDIKAVEQPEKAEPSQEVVKLFQNSIDEANKMLKQFLISMGEVEAILQGKITNPADFSQLLTYYYRNKVICKESVE